MSASKNKTTAIPSNNNPFTNSSFSSNQHLDSAIKKIITDNFKKRETKMVYWCCCQDWILKTSMFMDLICVDIQTAGLPQLVPFVQRNAKRKIRDVISFLVFDACILAYLTAFVIDFYVGCNYRSAEYSIYLRYYFVFSYRPKSVWMDVYRNSNLS